MHYVALGAGQADVSQTRSSSLRTRVKDVLARAGADAVDDAIKLCRAMEITGLSTECTTSGYRQSVDVRFNTSAAEAQKICAGMVDVAAKEGLSFGGKWKLRIFSPFSGDHPIAVCTLK
jgi:hypothetical protein